MGVGLLEMLDRYAVHLADPPEGLSGRHLMEGPASRGGRNPDSLKPVELLDTVDLENLRTIRSVETHELFDGLPALQGMQDGTTNGRRKLLGANGSDKQEAGQ